MNEMALQQPIREDFIQPETIREVAASTEPSIQVESTFDEPEANNLKNSEVYEKVLF